MKKPIGALYNGAYRWTHTKRGLVEYLAHEAKGVITSEALADGMREQFQSPLSPSALSNITAMLAKAGKLKIVRRGMFLHTDHASIFD